MGLTHLSSSCCELAKGGGAARARNGWPAWVAWRIAGCDCTGCGTLIRIVSLRAHSRCLKLTPNWRPVKESFETRHLVSHELLKFRRFNSDQANIVGKLSIRRKSLHSIDQLVK